MAPLVLRVARKALRRARGEAATPDFGRLLLFQASGAAGDALVALALAGSLFFSVPEATARDRVLLYLGLTVAPFAVVAPFLSRFLDRHRGSLRVVVIAASLGRGTLAWLLATRLDTFLLFPIAFGILLLSRAALVVRGALLPNLVPEGRTLVHANASLSRAAAVAGTIAVLPALLFIRWPGPNFELLFTAFVYYLGAVPALRLPASRGRRARTERLGARAATRVMSVRQAVLASAGMRALVGFLIFHLAFALRREELGAIGLGVLVGAAGAGSLIGAFVTPRIRRKLREEGILVATLVVAGVAGVLTGRFFSLVSAAVLVLVFGLASGAAKLAFDSIVQRDVPEGARGWAFARFESTLQLAWVAGALLPLVVPIPAGAGVTGAGIVANLVALVYVIGRERIRRRTLPTR